MTRCRLFCDLDLICDERTCDRENYFFSIFYLDIFTYPFIAREFVRLEGDAEFIVDVDGFLGFGRGFYFF